MKQLLTMIMGFSPLKEELEFVREHPFITIFALGMVTGLIPIILIILAEKFKIIFWIAVIFDVIWFLYETYQYFKD